jgi:transposase InsO family protein
MQDRMFWQAGQTKTACGNSGCEPITTGWSSIQIFPGSWRDCIYGAVVTRRLRAMGIRDKPIAPASPWQNGFVERLIGSIRRECEDHIIVLGEAHLRRILKILRLLL